MSFDDNKKRVAANDPHLQYTGRIDTSDCLAPVLTWPGTQIVCRFVGTAVSVVLHDQWGKNYFNAILDGDIHHPVVIACKEGEHVYTIANDLSEGEHTLVLYKRTEGEEGGVIFSGILLKANAELLTPPPRPTRRIEFYGDSITSGYGIEALEGAAEDLPCDKNNFLSYAAICARDVQAEAHMIAQSGIGIMTSWVDFIMPAFYQQVNAVGENQSRWDFSQWTPDVVVINLFQNDYGLIDQELRIVPAPNDDVCINKYKDFIEALIRHYPEAYFICSLGGMAAVKEGSRWPGYIARAVECLRGANPKLNIDTLFFNYIGQEGHPRVHHNQINAKILTDFVKEKMQW